MGWWNTGRSWRNIRRAFVRGSFQRRQAYVKLLDHNEGPWEVADIDLEKEQNGEMCAEQQLMLGTNKHFLRAREL